MIEDCAHCEGVGEIDVCSKCEYESPAGDFASAHGCPACDSSTWVCEPCPECEGTGDAR